MMDMIEFLEVSLNYARSNIDVIEIFVIVFVLPYLLFKGKKRFEDIRKQNKEILEQGERRHQFDMAAFDKKLQAHQEAYGLWWRLRWSVDNEQNVDEITEQCQEWWVNNCLYLDAESRQAFFNAVLSAGVVFKPKYSNKKRVLMEHIGGAGRTIVKGAGVPPIKVDELEFPLESPE